jgi:hypothetical protein
MSAQQTIGKSEITATDSSQATTQLNYWNSFQQSKQKCYNCRSRAISCCDGMAADIPLKKQLERSTKIIVLKLYE